MQLLYEIITLNGEKIVVVYKPEGMAEVQEKYSHLPIYSYVEMEAMDGLDSEEQKVLQEAKLVFGGAIYTAENFNKYFQLGKVEKMARNKEFDDALDELKMLHDAKNHDYATAENPYKNLEGVSRIGIEPWRGIIIRLMDKFERVEQYCSNGELAIKSEGMEDTFKDIAVYST